ncbi:PDZ domain-containing protein [Paenibacillus alkaliterrae]|uniref:PDZ domain-containing protein n=1 Tax=Paenibacillus alkaliterrae TaxID=320909 RepID=UPI001F365DF6|nr:PDZ domain-containing protein [Paenibacillus alkaliterrae]MCF2938760.1 PDZ domain-containing protein [Paenibacillus alkaliterrae]
MRKPARYYIIGLAVAVACLVAAELIWLPAPVRMGNGMQWVEMIDRLFYGLVLVPISWAVGALLGIWEHRRERRVMHGMLQLVRVIIAMLSMIGAYFVLFAPDRLILLFIIIGSAAPLIFMDMLFSEALERPAKSLRMPKQSGAVMLVTAMLLMVLLYPTGYRVTYPGMTINMNRYAHAEGGESGGTVNGVLVFERPAVSADWLYARLLPLYEFEKLPDDEPPLTESYAQVVAMKTDANDVAAAVAMQKAGVGDGISAEGVRVVAVVKDSPAEQRLQAGDIIDKLDEQSVRSIGDMMSYMIESVQPGQTILVTLRREGAVLQIEVPTTAAADAAERPVFGISVQTELHLDIPRSVDYKRFMAHIGGPSHGAMMTLAIIDQLTPGGVTRGLQVAGTGTIEPDGSVGLIGGIRQKAYAVSRTNADVFFVPAVQEEDARSAAPDLNIVPVKTIDDVLDWLARQDK